MADEPKTSPERLIDQPETAIATPRGRADHLRDHRWQKGQASPNPKGRPPDDSLPISNRLRSVLKLRLPSGELRDEIEKVAGKLPKKATLGDAAAVMMIFSGMGKFPNFRLEVMREVREATEGRSTPRAFVPGAMVEEGPAAEPENTEDLVLLGVLKMMKKRKELYNLESPRFDALMEEGKKEAAKTE
jgi:hypothetical protein